MKQRLQRLLTTLALGLGILAQSGCFYLTRNFLREEEFYTATTEECRIATTDAGGELYARFSPADFALVAKERPWLRNPLAVHFSQRKAGAARTTVLIIPDPDGIPSSAALEFKAMVDGSDLSKGMLVDASAPLPAAPSQAFVVRSYNRHYTSNPLRYCAAPVFVIGDVLVNIITLGFAGGYGCAKQDEGDRFRRGTLILEPASMPGRGGAP